MATAEKPQPQTAADETTASRRRRFNVEEYYRMAEAGILKPEERVELIEGDVIEKFPISPPHSGCVNFLSQALILRTMPRAIVGVRGPVRLDDRSEPEPDLAMLRHRADFYRKALPGPADVLVVIEVMDASVRYVRGKKLGLYARAGIPEVWLVDLNGELVEVHRRPVGGAYAEMQTRKRGESVAPDAFPDVVLGVDAILG